MASNGKSANHRANLSELASIGINIGKDVLHIVAFDREGEIVLRRKIKRMALVETFKKAPRCIVGLEACLSAHHISHGG